MSEPITVETTVNAPLARVWDYWNIPEHITQWAFASPDWEAPSSENNLQPGGTFKTVMAARDGSNSFEFSGTYTEVRERDYIAYTMDDGRRVETTFTETPEGVRIAQTFDPENENPAEMQRAGWQAILDNFKSYTEANQ